MRRPIPNPSSPSSFFLPSLAAGSHYFQFSSELHGFPLLGVQFIVNSSFQFGSAQVITCPASTDHHPIIHVLWKSIPHSPPYLDIARAVTLTPLSDTDISSLLMAIELFIEAFHEPLEPPTAPLVSN